MLAALKTLIWLGVDKQRTHQITAIKLTNTLALLCALLLVSQFFVMSLLQTPLGWAKPLVLLIHASVMLAIPWLCQRAGFAYARATLIYCFCSYISLSAVMWQGEMGMHYYLLLTTLVCSLVFYPWENALAQFHMMLSIGLFVALELNWFRRSLDDCVWHRYLGQLGQ